ncbi:MAG: hypothetical protein HYR94_24250 [Chloroflexi bacterium]|nr:hypothetical protein [Chloroflexota bacterium]
MAPIERLAEAMLAGESLIASMRRPTTWSLLENNSRANFLGQASILRRLQLSILILAP